MTVYLARLPSCGGRYPSLGSPTGGGESEIHSLLYLFCTTVANGIMWLYSHHTTAPLTFLQYISALNFTIELTYFGIVSIVPVSVVFVVHSD